MSSAEREFSTAYGTLLLERYPLRRNQTLRAWDAADDFLLSTLAEEESGPSSVLILNDAFGALTTALAPALPTAGADSPGGEPRHVGMMSDSFLTHAATRMNLESNQRDARAVTFLDSLQTPAHAVDTLLFKVPKSLALLEDQLLRLRPYLTADTRIIGAGMVKQIHTSTLRVCEEVLGPTATTKARRKARLIHCRHDPDRGEKRPPEPSSYALEGTGWQLLNHAALFSRERLDAGTGFLLEHLPRSPQVECIIDLGCGNGVLGIAAGRQHREAHLIFADESAMAIASARANVAAILGDREASFHWADCLGGIDPGCADVVLCNPPFHQQQAMGDATAWQMFTEARRALRTGGSLWVVGNRHLGYHAKLRRLFGNGEVIASNPKFVILKSTKSGR